VQGSANSIFRSRGLQTSADAVTSHIIYPLPRRALHLQPRSSAELLVHSIVVSNLNHATRYYRLACLPRPHQPSCGDEMAPAGGAVPGAPPRSTTLSRCGSYAVAPLTMIRRVSIGCPAALLLVPWLRHGGCRAYVSRTGAAVPQCSFGVFTARLVSLCKFGFASAQEPWRAASTTRARMKRRIASLRKSMFQRCIARRAGN
jgi:hypothetical protein